MPEERIEEAGKRMVMVTLRGGTTPAQPLTELTGGIRQCILVCHRGKHLDTHAGVLRVDLDHHMTVLVSGLAGPTQVVVVAHRALEAGSMKIANPTTITDNAAMAHDSCTTTASSSSISTVLGATAFLHNYHDASGHLIWAINLNHRVWLLGFFCFAYLTQIVIITHGALEARSRERRAAACITLDTDMGNGTE
jgi:hypothetical protein